LRFDDDCRVALPVSAAASAADCGGNGAFMTQLCKRCTITSERSTKRDTACSGGYDFGGSRLGGGRADTAVMGSAVAKRPQHGSVQLSGSSWTYTPAKGFTGKDSMTLEWDVVSQNTVYVWFSEIHMTVQ
jgi:hypothetical protein